MKLKYHILNGDCLKEIFPQKIDGEKIVARECFVDGDVSSSTLDDLFITRAKFISEVYGVSKIKKYYEDSVSEFKKIQNIPDKSEINLWFEDDLFCQVNFWFVVYLISSYLKNCKVFLVRPMKHTQYGFGGLNNKELVSLYVQKSPIYELDSIASLWKSYQIDGIKELKNTANELEQKYPFILKAVEAHIERIPNGSSLGRPTQTLLDIMNELKTDSFPIVFREFNKRESIYGFGDLQVKRLFDQIKDRFKNV